MELLREHGLRVTPQRILLVDIVRALPDHFTAEDVYRQMAERYPAVSLVSVYRGLETLRRLGLVTRTALGESSAAYEWAPGKRHHHLICTGCGHEQELDDMAFDVLRAYLREHYGFSAAIDHHAIFGRCARCNGADVGVDRPYTEA